MVFLKIANFIVTKFPISYNFAYRRVGRICHLFPYRPILEGQGEVDGAEWLVVRPSLIPDAGNGLFVTQFCAKGTVLCEYRGTKLSQLQMLRTVDWTYCANYGCEFWIDAREHLKVKARFINENFDPSKRNVEWAYRDGRIFIEAARDILPGEELYTEYGAEYWKDRRYFG